MSSIMIPQNQWENFLQEFSREHSRAPVKLQTYDFETDELVDLGQVSLISVDFDLEDEKNPRINVLVEIDSNKTVKHILFLPSSVTLHLPETGDKHALQIRSLRTMMTIRFQGDSSTVKPLSHS